MGSCPGEGGAASALLNQRTTPRVNSLDPEGVNVDAINIITVMGPEDTSSGKMQINPVHPHQFLTNKTNKKDVRDSLRAWIQMMNSFAEADPRYKAHVNGAGHLVFMMCDSTSKEILKQTEKDGKISLWGVDGDPKREKLIEAIIDILATETPAEIVRVEVETLSDIISCVRKKNETPREFATRFRGSIARYVNISTMLSPAVSRQFAVLMLRNSELSHDTMNAIMYQLSAVKANSEKDVTVEVKIPIRDIENWRNTEGTDQSRMMEIFMGSVRRTLAEREFQKDRPQFSLEDAASAISQALMEPTRDISGGDRTYGLLGGREYRENRMEKIRRMKEESECKAYGKRGHWWTDNEDCWRIIYTKRGRMDNGAERNVRPRTDGEGAGMSRSLFATTGGSGFKPDDMRDLNPMMDEGAPVSIGGIENAARLCDALGIRFDLSPPRAVYRHGWGTQCADSKLVVATWYMKVPDRSGKPTVIPFDMVEGDSPLLLGLDVKKFANTLNLANPPTIRIKRPSDTEERQFPTYLSKDMHGNLRTWIELVPNRRSTVQTLMAINTKHNTLNIVKKIHRFTHASPADMIRLLESAGYKDDKLQSICETVHGACDICASSGRPSNMRKVSISHVNQSFNQEIQADFLVANIRGERFDVLNIVDAGTGYGERFIVTSRNAGTMRTAIETRCFYQHGAPTKFSADPEFCQPILRRFLEMHNVELADRPARSSNKNGIVERNNGVFKTILPRITKENTDDAPVVLIARASLLANMLHGTGVLSAFQLARGYQPSILGVPSARLPDEVRKAHIEVTALRALHKILKYRSPRIVPPSLLTQGRPVWVSYKTSKQNVPVGSISATIEETRQHYALCRHSQKGPSMKVAYEHIRLKPISDLAMQMMQTSLETELQNITIDREEFEDDDTPLETNGAGDDLEEIDDTGDLEQGAVKSLLASYATCAGEPILHIGQQDATGPSKETEELSSQYDEVVAQIHDVIQNEQVVRKHIQFAPPWILEKAVRKEVEENWDTAYEIIHEDDLEKGANVVDSHFVYKVKTEEGGKRRLKARLCPHGNRDRVKGVIRYDAVGARFDVMRMMLSIAVTIGLMIGCIDIKGAFLQSGPINRDLYVRPPKELNLARGILWRLTKLPYGIAEAGRQWARTSEHWMIMEAGMKRVHGISQLFIKRDGNGDIELVIAKITDDLLFAGKRDSIDTFVTELSQRFRTSKVVIGKEVMFNGCRILQDHDGNVTMDMSRYVEQIRTIEISSDRKVYREDTATYQEMQDYRRLTGEMIWIGSGVLPQALLVGSVMQQRIPTLTVNDLIEGNRMLKEMKDLRVMRSWR